MERSPIAIEHLTVKSYSFFEVDWLLLTCGDYSQRHYNAMTISWGSLGVMWGRPFIQVVVRPHRYTYEFIERYESFTVCAFPKEYHQALSLLGAKSGREMDKIAQAGLTPIPATCVAAPAYTEAGLVIECRKIYWQDLDPAHFLDPAIARNYPHKDYHRIYYGEILAVQGTEQYHQK
jgi:flavin reductase (DIM6/NTAB) family NADH-FMN oxidoreductase RutF